MKQLRRALEPELRVARLADARVEVLHAFEMSLVCLGLGLRMSPDERRRRMSGSGRVENERAAARIGRGHPW